MNNPESDDDSACCDALLALADLTFDFARHEEAQTLPNREEVRRWSELIFEIHSVIEKLENACEDLIEPNLDDPRYAALKLALARAQGLPEYWKREDRW